MYNTILKLRYRMIVNFVHEAGFLPSILVFLLAIGLLYIVTKLPDGCLAITAACMLFSIHLSRNDAEMLRILSPRLPKQVLIVDYYLAMLPFATASLCTGSVKNVSCCLLLPACLALVPPIHADWKIPTHPLIRRGSIFYSGNFRMLFILMLQHNDIYILDEPFNGLDLEGCILLRKWLSDMRGRGKLIIVSSHIISALTDICNEIFYIHQGRIAGSFKDKTAAEIEAEIGEFIMNDNSAGL